MPLRLLPVERDGDDPLLGRICALQVMRNTLSGAVCRGDPVAVALIVVIDEMLLQIRERAEREGVS